MAERLYWEELNPGDEAVSLNRTITEADVVSPIVDLPGDQGQRRVEARGHIRAFGNEVVRAADDDVAPPRQRPDAGEAQCSRRKKVARPCAAATSVSASPSQR